MLAFFAGKRFSLKPGSSVGLGALVRHLFEQAKTRQRQICGSAVLGTVLQHLVGARLGDFRTDLKLHSASRKDGAKSPDF